MREVKRAVITGATGMIGANLARRLLREGIEVRALCRPDSPKIRNLPQDDPNLLVVPCSLSEIPTLSEEPSDAWFHFGWDGVYGEARNDEARQMKNVDYTLQALRKATACGVKRFIFAGSQAEYGPVSGILSEDTPMHPVNAYGKAKKAAEEAGKRLAAELSVDFMAARILSVYGPYDNDYTMVMSAIHKLLRGEKPSFTKGEQIWDYLYAEDAASAMEAIMRHGKAGKSYVLGSGSGAPLSDYIEAIRDAVDPTLPLGLGEIPYAENQVMHLVADTGSITEDTGWKAETPFTEGIHKTVRYAREKGNL